MNITLQEKRHLELVHYAKQTAEMMRDNPDVTLHRNPSAKLPGDTRSLRGIPVLARGVGGAMPGTNPLAYVMSHPWQAA